MAEVKEEEAEAGELENEGEDEDEDADGEKQCLEKLVTKEVGAAAVGEAGEEVEGVDEEEVSKRTIHLKASRITKTITTTTTTTIEITGTIITEITTEIKKEDAEEEIIEAEMLSPGLSKREMRTHASTQPEQLQFLGFGRMLPPMTSRKFLIVLEL